MWLSDNTEITPYGQGIKLYFALLLKLTFVLHFSKWSWHDDMRGVPKHMYVSRTWSFPGAGRAYDMKVFTVPWILTLHIGHFTHRLAHISQQTRWAQGKIVVSTLRSIQILQVCNSRNFSFSSLIAFWSVMIRYIQ